MNQHTDREVMRSDLVPDPILFELLRLETPEPEFRETLLAQCFDALPDVIQVMSAASKTLFRNRAAYQYFGPRVASALWPDDRDSLFHPDDREPRRTARERVLREGLGARLPVRAVRYDYAMLWHVCELTPLFDRAATVRGLLIRMTEMRDANRGDAIERLRAGAP